MEIKPPHIDSPLRKDGVLYGAEVKTKSRNIREVVRVDLDAKERLREKMAATQG